jgi:hypothetical protein
MELLTGLVIAVVIGGLLWIAGLIRAVRRQPIDDRLRTYCQRR